MVGHHTSLVTGLSVDTLDDLGLRESSNGTLGQSSSNLENLYPALVQCFGIILLGWLAGKFSFISDVEAKGLGTFVGVFSLPALIFVSLFLQSVAGSLAKSSFLRAATKAGHFRK